MPFIFRPLEIPGLVQIEPEIMRDERGLFMEIYKQSGFTEHGINENFVQDNYSISSRNVLRGLHYQINPKAQGKLVSCIRGRIFDVAVDIRVGSQTYGKWIGIELSDENLNMLYVPPGFAHGFVSLADVVQVIYKCTEEYSQKDERGIIWNDSDINIDWPVKQPVLSPKDAKHPKFREADNNFFFRASEV